MIYLDILKRHISTVILKRYVSEVLVKEIKNPFSKLQIFDFDDTFITIITTNHDTNLKG